IKVWICRGEVYGKKDLAPNFTSSKDSHGHGDSRSGNRSDGGKGPRRNRRNNKNA
ncbi:MAG TPA: 30S ribosomal protein S3, partial [Clostridiales bacterium]|nr:30S ribosomal protein S3 [Clostridiales bacterium]